MSSKRRLHPVFILCAVFLAGYVAVAALVYFGQRSLLYYPSHESDAQGLARWTDDDGNVIGYSREAASPRKIWFMMHGNAAQAAQRGYVLRRMSERDSLYVLEYPGYGLRAGSPTRASMNAAALEAYSILKKRNPKTPVCVLGESIGSGPASHLAGTQQPPDKIVLVVPFDSLANVASGRMPFLPARLLLRDRWDNVDALKAYAGPIDIYGAVDDEVIPFTHAKALAERVPRATFHAIPGRHNDWSEMEQVRIE